MLGGRTKRASWVVNAKTGEPTGYGADEKHPDLHRTEQIIRTGEELSQLLNPPADSNVPLRSGWKAGEDGRRIKEGHGIGPALGSGALPTSQK